jgi:hypothetical protein
MRDQEEEVYQKKMSATNYAYGPQTQRSSLRRSDGVSESRACVCYYYGDEM